ncbi:MAG: hypothetical protein SGCHY_003378 [Lobulomycetales sp.]
MDRLWCLGRPDSDGPAQYCFVSQREIPKMALIAVSLPGSSPVPGIIDRGGMLAVSASWMDRELRLPFGLDIPVPVVSCSIRVWDDTVDGLDQGDEAAEWFSQCLGAPGLRLFRKDLSKRRAIIPIHTPVEMDSLAETAFADGFPLLIITKESIKSVNDRLADGNELDFPGQQVSPLNFRGNVVLAGFKQFEEEEFKVISIGSQTFFVCSRCTRCSIPTVNLDTGEKGKQPSKILMKNAWRRVDPGSKYNACFGMNCIAKESGFCVSVGQQVRVVERSMDHHRKIGVWRSPKV